MDLQRKINKNCLKVMKTYADFPQDDIFIHAETPLPQHMSSKLFTTFTTHEDLDSTIKNINSKYQILFDKIFVLDVEGKDELICTYNIDSFNISSTVLPNTILLHRKKEFNVLFSINSLNMLTMSLNKGKMDPKFDVPWENYKNSIMLVTDGELKIFSTKIYRIVNL